MNIDILITNSENADFIKLIGLLDEDLYNRYGDAMDFYGQFNKVHNIKDVIIVYKDKVPSACGAFKEYSNNSVEIKRIFVLREQRRNGFAKLILNQLEEIAKGRGYEYAVLETGTEQQEAINLYKSCGYSIIPNYAPYEGCEDSVCMKKAL